MVALNMMPFGASPPSPGGMMPPAMAMPTPDQIEEAQAIMEACTWEEISGILRSDERRNYTIDVETDSTAFEDQETEKQQRIEFMVAMTTWLQSAIPATQANPSLAPLMKELTMFSVSAFPIARSLEEAFEDAFDQVQNMPPQPNPEAEKAKAEMEMAQQQFQMDMQLKTVDLKAKQSTAQINAQGKQADIQAKQQSIGMDMQAKQADLAAKQQMAQMEMQIKLAELEIKKQELAIKLRTMEVQQQMETQRAAIEQQTTLQKAAIERDSMDRQAQHEERSMERSEEHEEATMALKQKAARQQTSAKPGAK
jgi:hypothetical protein